MRLACDHHACYASSKGLVRSSSRSFILLVIAASHHIRPSLTSSRTSVVSGLVTVLVFVLMLHTVLRLSVVRTECIVGKWVVAKRRVLEQKLLLTFIGSRIWEINWYQNEWQSPLFRGRIKVMSTTASHSSLNISETVRDRGLVPKEHDRKWPMGYQMVTWSMTSCDSEMSNSWSQYA